MSEAPCPVYLFRSQSFAPSGDTIVSLAPMEQVAAVYGGGGVFGEGGLSNAFGGAAVFRNEATGEHFAGVWGARNASRFRREMRERIKIVLRHEAPDARLVVWNAEGRGPGAKR